MKAYKFYCILALFSTTALVAQDSAGTLDGEVEYRDSDTIFPIPQYVTVTWQGKLILLWEDCPLKNEDGTVNESPDYDIEELGNAMIHHQYGMYCYVRTFPDIEIGLRSDGFMVWRKRTETTATKVSYEGYREPWQ